MNTPAGSRYQQWDRHGKAVGYAADPSIIHTPKPQVANTTFSPSKYPRDVEEASNFMDKHGRQESTDVVGWHQGSLDDGDPYASDSFIQIPSLNTRDPNQRHEVQQTPTQSNFVNGPLPLNPSPTNDHFEDVYASTTSLQSALDSPHQEHNSTLPNPFEIPGQLSTSQPEISQSPPHPRSSPPLGYMIDLR